MGFSGSFVLVAGDDAVLDEVGLALDYASYTSGGTGWTAAEFDDDAIFWNREQVLDQLVRATNRPAVVALCLDSDFLGLAGLTPGAARWSGAVDLAAARGYRREGVEEGYEDVVPDFPDPETAIAGCIEWARAAELTPDEHEIRRIFMPHEWSQPADMYWPDLLDALGMSAT